MPLTDAKCRNAKPQDRTQRIFDGRGLYLEVAPSGGRWWRLKYRFNGKEKRISLGTYPDVDLKTARTRCDDARKLVTTGVDPSEQRKANKVAAVAQTEADKNTFEAIAREWYSKKSETWNPDHAKRVLSSLERDVFPFIGGRSIKAVETPEIVTVMRRIEARRVRETAHRVLQRVSEVFVFALAAGICDRNPAADMVSALAPKAKVENFPAVIEPKRFGELLRILDGYEGTYTVRCALRLAPLVAVRPGEFRKAKWADVNLDSAEWRYQITKTDTPHIVPLSRQAVAILRELHKLTGESQYVFPSARSNRRPMSDNAVLAALRRMGIPADEVSGHGFRASFRTMAHEILRLPVEHLEMQLGHKVKDALGTSYNRTTFLPERRKSMQKWSDFCDRLRAGAGAEVIQIRA
jgi:integrase